MTGVSALWIPIVLSSVLVFVVSSIIHMMSPWHKNDYPKLPNQDGIMDALRPFSLQPGDYMVPRPDSMADMKSPQFIEKVNKGPKVVMTVMQPGMTGMGKQLSGWFVYLLLVSTFAAYVAGRALPANADVRRHPIRERLDIFTPGGTAPANIAPPGVPARPGCTLDS